MFWEAPIGGVWIMKKSKWNSYNWWLITNPPPLIHNNLINNLPLSLPTPQKWLNVVDYRPDEKKQQCSINIYKCLNAYISHLFGKSAQVIKEYGELQRWKL